MLRSRINHAPPPLRTRVLPLGCAPRVGDTGREPASRGESTMTDPPTKPRRRWRPTVSVRLLMGVVLVLGVFLGWRVNRASTQRELVAAIKRVGGEVTYDNQLVGDVFYYGDPQPWAPAW